MREAISAADPLKMVPPYLPARPKGRTVVVGAGKASAMMAKAVEDCWGEEISGLIITRYGFNVPCRHIKIIEAGHPVPDVAGEKAASSILDISKGLGPDDLCLALMSGGASALLIQPAPEISLSDKQEVNRMLLRSGANITEINTVRKHLSAIKGGRLAQAIAPAKLVTLMISDVPGDDPGVIGSGPTIPDPTTFADALAVINKYQINPPQKVQSLLESGLDETPKPDDQAFINTEQFIIARPQFSLDAAAEVARQAGIEVIMMSDCLEGEAREVARTHASMARTTDGPKLFLSGGELTVTINGNGRGGPNTEYALALAIALNGDHRIHAMAIDTDGIDGSEDNAGAWIKPDTLVRANAAGLNADHFLSENDSYGFFSGIGDLIVTGPTFTNVNDFRAVLVLS